MSQRNHVKHTLPLTDRLLQAAKEARLKAEKLQPGTAKEALLQKARSFEGQVEINDFLTSPGSPWI